MARPRTSSSAPVRQRPGSPNQTNRRIPMFVAPGTMPFGYKLTRSAAQEIARNWWALLLNGALLIVAGFLIFSIDWTIRSLATFLGVLFIVQGVAEALTTGIDVRVRRANVVTGLLSIAAGAVVIIWPGPGLLALGIILGAWLIVMGTIAIAGAFAARSILSDWWLLLLLGIAEVALGVLALANPGATLAAIVTVGGIWAVAIGVLRIVLSFQVKRLPDDVDTAWSAASANGDKSAAKPDDAHLAPPPPCPGPRPRRRHGSAPAGAGPCCVATSHQPGDARASDDPDRPDDRAPAARRARGGGGRPTGGAPGGSVGAGRRAHRGDRRRVRLRALPPVAAARRPPPRRHLPVPGAGVDPGRRRARPPRARPARRRHPGGVRGPRRWGRARRRGRRAEHRPPGAADRRRRPALCTRSSARRHVPPLRRPLPHYGARRGRGTRAAAPAGRGDRVAAGGHGQGVRPRRPARHRPVDRVPAAAAGAAVREPRAGPHALGRGSLPRARSQHQPGGRGLHARQRRDQPARHRGDVASPDHPRRPVRPGARHRRRLLRPHPPRRRDDRRDHRRARDGDRRLPNRHDRLGRVRRLVPTVGELRRPTRGLRSRARRRADRHDPRDPRRGRAARDPRRTARDPDRRGDPDRPTRLVGQPRRGGRRVVAALRRSDARAQTIRRRSRRGTPAARPRSMRQRSPPTSCRRGS